MPTENLSKAEIAYLVAYNQKEFEKYYQKAENYYAIYCIDSALQSILCAMHGSPIDKNPIKKSIYHTMVGEVLAELGVLNEE